MDRDRKAQGMREAPATFVAAADQRHEVLAGLVERVTFHSTETGFCVLRVMTRGHRDLVTTVGHAAMISAGEWIPIAARAILKLMPLDTFVPAPVWRMEVGDDTAARMPVFDQMQAVIDAAEGRDVPMAALERFAFYAAARRAFAIVRTPDSGPYGCFILRKGVVDLSPLIST